MRKLMDAYVISCNNESKAVVLGTEKFAIGKMNQLIQNDFEMVENFYESFEEYSRMNNWTYCNVPIYTSDILGTFEKRLP